MSTCTIMLHWRCPLPARRWETVQTWGTYRICMCKAVPIEHRWAGDSCITGYSLWTACPLWPPLEASLAPFSPTLIFQNSSLIFQQRCLQGRIHLCTCLLPIEVSGFICNQEPENVSAWNWRLYCELNVSLAFCSHLQIKALQARHLRIIENKIHLECNICFPSYSIWHIIIFGQWIWLQTLL